MIYLKVMNNRNFKIVLIISAVGILIAHFAIHNNNTHSKQTGKTETPQQVSSNNVEVKNYAYLPQKTKVKKGTTVTWKNSDRVLHTVTMSDRNKKGPDSELFGRGKKYSYTFNETGTFDYYCKSHPYMKGSIEVTD